MTKEDLAYHKALMKLLDEATFSLKAREVAAFTHVYNWAKDLPNKIVEKPEIKVKK